MTLANRITLIRMLLSLAIFALIVSKTLFSLTAALVLLAVAGISDYVDGVIARRTHTTTPFGAIADPFADKILIMAVFLAFAAIKEIHIPLWAVFLILLRELTISTLRVLAALHGEVMKAESTGKFKTFVQISAAFIILIILLLGKTGVGGNGAAVCPLKRSAAEILQKMLEYRQQIIYYTTVVTAFVTVLSGIVYLYRHKELLEKSWSEKKAQ